MSRGVGGSAVLYVVSREKGRLADRHFVHLARSDSLTELPPLPPSALQLYIPRTMNTTTSICGKHLRLGPVTNRRLCTSLPHPSTRSAISLSILCPSTVRASVLSRRHQRHSKPCRVLECRQDGIPMPTTQFGSVANASAKAHERGWVGISACHRWWGGVGGGFQVRCGTRRRLRRCLRRSWT